MKKLLQFFTGNPEVVKRQQSPKPKIVKVDTPVVTRGMAMAAGAGTVGLMVGGSVGAVVGAAIGAIAGLAVNHYSQRPE